MLDTDKSGKITVAEFYFYFFSKFSFNSFRYKALFCGRGSLERNV